MTKTGAFAMVSLLLACGDNETAPTAPAEAPIEAAEVAPSEPVGAPEVPAEVLAPPVNLLEVVESFVAASSVYRGHATEVIRMVDGDLETAWNSDSGDLEGAWIDVRVPADVVVTGARIVVGFAHNDGGRDLFTANPRIAKLRVLREGVALGEFELDTTRRDLQAIAFDGEGGTYRLEIIETLAGSNAEWREVCVSEFQLMGRAANEGANGETDWEPHTFVGRLPPASAVPAVP